MQDHPKRLDNTNCAKLAREMHSVRGTYDAKRLTLTKMVNNQVIHRMGTKYKSCFRINYLHKDVLPFVRARASKEDKEVVRKALSMAKAHKGKLTKEGCVQTVTPKKKIVIKQEEKPAVSVPVKVKRNQSGQSISINLTINLNQ